MHGTTPREDKNLLLDLLKELKGSGAVHPDDIAMRKVVKWFPFKNARPPQKLVDLLVEDSEAPVEYTVPDNSRVWLTGESEVEDYIESLRETPWDKLNIEGDGPIVPDLDRFDP